jgi:hypothetical protein
MKSQDIAIVGILLAVGAIVRYVATTMVPGPITSNLVIGFYCLAIILVLPKYPEALGIGIISGIICSLITHSVFPPGNLISEPVGALACLTLYMLIKDRIKLVAPGITTFVATLASGFTFIALAVLFATKGITDKAVAAGGDPTNAVNAFITASLVIVVTCAIVNAIIVQILYIPASRALMRGNA